MATRFNPFKMDPALFAMRLLFEPLDHLEELHAALHDDGSDVMTDLRRICDNHGKPGDFEKLHQLVHESLLTEMDARDRTPAFGDFKPGTIN